MHRSLLPALLLGTLAHASVPLIPEAEQPVVPVSIDEELSISPVVPELDGTSPQSARPGRHVLDLIVEGPGRFALVNVSARDQQVLPALDGSDMGWRIPKVTVEWRDATGEPVLPRPMGRCGNMNPLMPGDWVTLAPGDRLTLPNGWMYLNPPEGAVEMRLTYDTMSPAGRPFGDGSGDDSTFAALPEGVWTSPWAPVRVPDR